MTERPLSSAVSRDTLAVAANTPLAEGDDASLREPKAPYMGTAAGGAGESPRTSSYQQTPTPYESAAMLAPRKEEFAEPPVAEPPAEKPKRRSLWLLALVALAALAVVIIAVIVPVYFKVIKPKNNTTVASSGGGASSTVSPGPTTTSPSKPTSTGGVSGGDGSTIRTANGTTFTYNNKFGGIWYADPNDPYNNNAYPNSWTPPLNKSWDFNTDRIYGVNLGGWFVLEPFISPALFQKYPGATDEWSLSTLMAADTASGGLNQLEEHYKTFITEDDFAEMAAAGLNWIRLPVPYWAIDTWDNEPFLAKVSWKYIVQAFQWARKYGLRVNLDLHTLPGSQSGYNHSGKGGQVNFLQGTMGLANAQRAMNYIRIFAEFIAQPEWRDVVPIFGIINEPVLDIDAIRGFYVEAYTMLRGITGVGAGKGFYISIHDSFQIGNWGGFMAGADRMILDDHAYFTFGGGPATDPIDTGTGPDAGGTWPQQNCDNWAGVMNTSRSAFGITVTGEWSNGINDCGTFLRGVAGTPSYGGNCADWTDASKWTEGTKAGLMRFGAASMDTFRDWFFWTWKIAPAQSGIVESPLWSYQLGLRGGWVPTDPRTALGTCGPSTGPIFDRFAPWMTGGDGAGVLTGTTYPYPPTALNAATLPLYTPTGAISTLPVPSYTNTAGQPAGTGNGWFNPNDNQPAPTPIPGCTYPDAWDAQSAAVPAGCTGTASDVVPAVINPPSRR